MRVCCRQDRAFSSESYKRKGGKERPLYVYTGVLGRVSYRLTVLPSSGEASSVTGLNILAMSLWDMTANVFGQKGRGNGGRGRERMRNSLERLVIFVLGA